MRFGGRGPPPALPSAAGLVTEEDGEQRVGQRDVLAIRPGVDSVPHEVATSSFDEYAPTFSPDGRYVAYMSEESGSPTTNPRTYH